jgi:MtrB/PioB family decaheme-associated outer membrane protein
MVPAAGSDADVAQSGDKMKAPARRFYPLSIIAAALSCAFGPANAQETDEVKALTTPSSVVEVGVAGVSKDNQRFGQYTGLNEHGGYGLLDFSIVRRDDPTGTWLRLTGRNLGFDDREMRFEQNRQGDWKYFIDYSQTPRFDPYTVSTQLTGIGTTTQTTVGSATPSEYHLKTERDTWTFGFDKAIASGLSLQVRYRDEKKEGARLWGQGTFSTWRFLTDPIDQTARQIEATLSYNREGLQLSGGYYGTAFENRNNVLNVGGAAAIAGLGQMALPPDNESHQFHLAGGYNFSKATRATFKLAYGRITQNELFPTTPTAGAPSSLNGEINTTLAQVGLTTRPMPRLTLRADLRYENRDDKTPVFPYFPLQATATSTNNGENEPRDIKTTSGKFEASYRLPAQLTLTGGLEHVEKKRNSPPVRAVSFRETTDETTLRAELRRSISETLTGAVGIIHSERGGSDWLINTFNNGTIYSNQVAPWHLADRDRDMLRLTVNWMPTDPLSLNFRVDVARDEYSGRGISVVDQTVREGQAENYSIDVGYAFSDAVQGTAWYSVNDTSLESQQCRSANGDVCTPGVEQVWASDVRNLADSFGLGLRAKVSAKIDVSADASYSKVVDKMLLTSIAGAAVDPLDTITTKVTTVRLSARYALQRNAGVRVTYIHDKYETDDWTWAYWNYSLPDGGTTVRQDPNQKVDFLGASYYYQF